MHQTRVFDLYTETSEHYDLDQLLGFLQTYKLSQYYHLFVSEGFDRLLSLFDITESDLATLNVKRGHRRLLQRAIATARGIPLTTPILINVDNGIQEYNPLKSIESRYKQMDNHQYQRKHRHRRRKQYVPARPAIAIDILSNELKLKNKGLLVSDIATMAYDRWCKLSIPEKEEYEREALHVNSDYILYGVDLNNRYCSTEEEI